jgi:hypothetical protein
MKYSGSRLTALAGAGVVICFAASACGATANGPVIGQPAKTTVAPVVGSANSALSAYEQALASELNLASQTGSDGQSTQLNAALTALDNFHTLITAEQMGSLKELGKTEVDKREAALSTLVGDVQSHPHLTSAQITTLFTLIDGVQAELQALGAKIANDSLPDVLRSDVLHVDGSTRVYGLVEPMVHIALAADDVEVLASSLVAQAFRLSGEVSYGSRLNAAQERSLLADANSQIGQMRSVAGSVLSQDLVLTPASYPGSSSMLTSLKSDLLGVQQGPAVQAQLELGEVTTCMADDVASPAIAC